MTAAELIDQVTMMGVRLSRGASGLCVRAPKGVLTEDLRGLLVARNDEILAELDRDHAWFLKAVAPPPECRNCKTKDAKIYLLMDDATRLCAACWRM